MDIKRKLDELRIELDVVKVRECTDAENKHYRELLREKKELPEGVFQLNANASEEYAYFNVASTELSKEEIWEYTQYKQVKLLTTIKNCLVFFTVLAVISLLAGVILSL